jgi:hypothetical protein
LAEEEEEEESVDRPASLDDGFFFEIRFIQSLSRFVL